MYLFRNLLSVEFGFSIPGATLYGAAINEYYLCKVSTWLRTSSTNYHRPICYSLNARYPVLSFLFDMFHINASNDASLILMIQNGCNWHFNNLWLSRSVVAIPNGFEAQKYFKTKEQRTWHISSHRVI